MEEIVIINGPNLNLLGQREPEIYGTQSFQDYLAKLQAQHTSVTITYFQSNVEGEIINYIHEKGFSAKGIILNAGGYTHTSVAIADAVAAISCPVIEVHISQPLAREKERHVSLLSKYAKGSISGFCLTSYHLALTYLLTY